MNELPEELKEFQTQLSELTPQSDSARNAELLRFFVATEPRIPTGLAKAKLSGFVLGGTLGICVGAIAMFFIMISLNNGITSEPVSVPYIYPQSEFPSTVMNFDTETLRPMQAAMSADFVNQLVPPPSAFWGPFSVAVLAVVFVMMLVKHLRIRLVF